MEGLNDVFELSKHRAYQHRQLRLVRVLERVAEECVSVSRDVLEGNRRCNKKCDRGYTS